MHVVDLQEAELAPGLLVAMPHLLDPNFHRAVVLMIEHNEEGSFGLVVNRPSTMSVSALLGALDMNWRGDNSAVVWTGGPVMPTSGWVLHEPSPRVGPGAPTLQSGLENDGTVSFAPGIDLSTSPDKLRVIADAPPERTRFLLGYAGWGPGQLATEMARGSWLHADADADLIFETPSDFLWETTLRSLGVSPESLVQSSGVH
ncbi:MAG TPA: YqgE/AlgH family protein [Kofleriaceae bacterium]|nr:YqgE/AlgH family protein [Kofleriaceae bacterium]